MTQTVPAFWVKYRGEVDPQKPSLTTAYNYSFTYTIVGNAPANLLYGCLGPPQLTKRDYIEVNWTPILGLVQVTVSRNTIGIFQSNGASQGFRDEGQIISSTGGVLNQ